jgi:hypothetical protein
MAQILYQKLEREDLDIGHFVSRSRDPAAVPRQRCLIITDIVIVAGMAKHRYKNMSSMWPASKDYTDRAKSQKREESLLK